MITELHQHRLGLIRLFTLYHNSGMPLSDAFDRLRRIYGKRNWLFVGRHSVEWNFLGQNVHRFWHAKAERIVNV